MTTTPTLQADLLRTAAYLDAENDDSNTMPLSEALRIAGVLRALAAQQPASIYPTAAPSADQRVREGMGKPGGVKDADQA